MKLKNLQTFCFLGEASLHLNRLLSPGQVFTMKAEASSGFGNLLLPQFISVIPAPNGCIPMLK